MTIVTSLRDRKKAATRQHIVDAAVRLFSERGFEDPTVDEIAAAADTGKGTIYNYFHTKEDILVAFIAEQEARIQKKMVRVLKRNLDPVSLLTLYLREQFNLKRRYRRFNGIFLSQVVLRGDEIAPYLTAMQPAIDETLKALFDSLRARGQIRHDIETETLVQVFKTLHFGLSAVWVIAGTEEKDVEALCAESVRIFCKGIER